MDIIPKDTYAFCWVTDFPAFEWDEDSERFSLPSIHKAIDEHIHLWEPIARERFCLMHTTLCATATNWWRKYRIHDYELQRRSLPHLDFPKNARDKFGFLLDALQYGAHHTVVL